LVWKNVGRSPFNRTMRDRVLPLRRQRVGANPDLSLKQKKTKEKHLKIRPFHRNRKRKKGSKKLVGSDFGKKKGLEGGLGKKKASKARIDGMKKVTDASPFTLDPNDGTRERHKVKPATPKKKPKNFFQIVKLKKTDKKKRKLASKS